MGYPFDCPNTTQDQLELLTTSFSDLYVVGSVRPPFFHEHTLNYIHPSVEEASIITYFSCECEHMCIYALDNIKLAFGRYVLITVCFSSYVLRQWDATLVGFID